MRTPQSSGLNCLSAACRSPDRPRGINGRRPAPGRRDVPERRRIVAEFTEIESGKRSDPPSAGQGTGSRRACVRSRILEPYEVQYWADKFGVSKERLSEAVRRVGHSADAVSRELGDVPWPYGSSLAWKPELKSCNSNGQVKARLAAQ
jgi:hypothetical protein